MIEDKYAGILAKAYEIFDRDYRNMFPTADKEDLKEIYEEINESENRALNAYHDGDMSQETLDEEMLRYGKESSEDHCLNIEFSDAEVQEGEDRYIDWASGHVDDNDIIIKLDYYFTLGKYDQEIIINEETISFYFRFDNRGEFLDSTYFY